MKKQIRTQAQRTDGKTRREINAHDFTLNDLNYSASIWGSLDYFEKPTTANLSVQVEMYGNGTFDIIRDIEIVECK